MQLNVELTKLGVDKAGDDRTNSRKEKERSHKTRQKNNWEYDFRRIVEILVGNWPQRCFKKTIQPPFTRRGRFQNCKPSYKRLKTKISLH